VLSLRRDRLVKAQTLRRRPGFVSRVARETVGELRKVSWPSRQEATQLTMLVLAVVLVSSLILGALDLVFQRLITAIVSLGA
jgi:preprotein translocase subunit SecE